MRGVWTALVTPFDEQFQLDLPSLERILEGQVNAGITGVIPCGSTGEAITLDLTEKKKVIQTVLQILKGTSLKIFAGTGTSNTQESIELSRWAESQGVDGVMLVTPYYNKPSPAGLEAHFRQIADSVSCEVMIYNVPGRTGVSLKPETISQLAAHPRIRSLKEASGNVAFTSEIRQVLSLHQRSIDILSGDDATYLPLLSVGASGVVSVASNLFPNAMVKIQTLMDQGQVREALPIHESFYPLFRDLFVETNPVPVKHALSLMGWCKNMVRLPLVGLTSSHAEKLEKSLIQCGIRPGVWS